tara:strand:+ start:42 stop:2207 length:2166 start_codon:yes stop_codon:yes gene_type:complete
MANEPLLGAPFQQGVRDQLAIRSRKKASNNLTDRDLSVQHGNNAWARISSGVVVEGNVLSAMENVLQGGVLSKRGAGFTPASDFSSYSKTDALGFRPMPGIDSIEIVSQNAQGTIRKTDVSFKLHTLEDLNVFEKLYLRPGFTVLLEYGHGAYYDNEGNPITNVPSVIDFFSSTDEEKVAAQTLALRKESSFNYDAIFGIIMNFQYSYNMEGGYDCTFYIISKGSLLDSILAISGGDLKNTSSKKGGIEGAFNNLINDKKSEDSKAYKKSEVLKILGRIYETAGQRDTQIETLIEDFPTLGLVDKSTPDSLSDKPFYLHDISTDISNAAKKVYITFNTLLKILNNTVMLAAANGRNIVSFGIATEKRNVLGDFLTYDDHFSSNPNVCLITSIPANKNFDAGAGNEGGRGGSPKKNQINRDILLDVSFLIRTYEALAKNKKEDRTVIDFLMNVFEEITPALGSINEFDFHYIEDDSTCYIVDRKITPSLGGIKSNVLPCFGKGSLLTNINVTSKISNTIMTMMAVGAQQSGANLQGYGGLVMNFNRGLKDRFHSSLKSKLDADKKINSSEDDEAKDYKEKKEDILKSIKQFVKARSFKQSEGTNLEQPHMFIANYDINRATNPPRGVLPFELSFTMQGIAGLKIGQGFLLQEGILPTSVQDTAGFIIKSINHSLSDNTWTTDISAYMTLVAPDYTKNTKDFPETPLDADTQDSISNRTDKSS